MPEKKQYDIIFIVPYRERISHKCFFVKMLASLKLPYTYTVLFSIPNNNLPFNRGAAKNIGALVANKHFDVTHTTLVFNDVDCMPYKNILHYKTSPGVVKHFYGFNYCLGGIFSIQFADFIKTNGFPNLWGWGMEDNIFQKRCLNAGLRIDRSQFYSIGSQEILHLFDGMERVTTQNNINHQQSVGVIDGLSTLKKIKHTLQKHSPEPNDDNDTSNEDDVCDVQYINTTYFETLTSPYSEEFHTYDLRNSSKKFMQSKLNTQSKSHVPISKVMTHASSKQWTQNILVPKYA